MAKPDEGVARALETFLEEADETVVMILTLPKLDKATQNRKWFKAVEQRSAFVQLWPVERKDMPAFMGQRLRQAKLTAERDVVELLIERVEGNLLAAVQEIERLKLLAPNGVVTAEVVSGSVGDSSRHDVFSMIDAAVAQLPARALKMLASIRAEGGDVLFVSNMLARELRSLVGMARDVAGGRSVESVVSRVWQKRKPAVANCLKSRSLRELEACLRQIADIDLQVKGMQKGQPWDGVEQSLLRLSNG